MATAKKKGDTIYDRIARQREWIRDHGGDRAGYVAHYGDPDTPVLMPNGVSTGFHGDGGTKIYEADMDALRAMVSQAVGSAHDWTLDQLMNEPIEAREPRRRPTDVVRERTRQQQHADMINTVIKTMIDFRATIVSDVTEQGEFGFDRYVTFALRNGRILILRSYGRGREAMGWDVLAPLTLSNEVADTMKAIGDYAIGGSRLNQIRNLAENGLNVHYTTGLHDHLRRIAELAKE